MKKLFSFGLAAICLVSITTTPALCAGKKSIERRNARLLAETKIDKKIVTQEQRSGSSCNPLSWIVNHKLAIGSIVLGAIILHVAAQNGLTWSCCCENFIDAVKNCPNGFDNPCYGLKSYYPEEVAYFCSLKWMCPWKWYRSIVPVEKAVQFLDTSVPKFFEVLGLAPDALDGLTVEAAIEVCQNVADRFEYCSDEISEALAACFESVKASAIS